jgi:hypothetical protein
MSETEGNGGGLTDLQIEVLLARAERLSFEVPAGAVRIPRTQTLSREGIDAERAPDR